MGGMATEPAIGTRIKRARERKRWTQKRLADLVGVSQKTIDNWENGRTEPRSSIGALEDVLGTRLDGDQIEPKAPSKEDVEEIRSRIREVWGENSPLEAALDASLKASGGAA